jgi:hypothetical protein
VLARNSDTFAGDTVTFTHSSVFALALARQLAGRPGPVLETLDELLRSAATFPLAWDAAEALILRTQDSQVIGALAGAADAVKRDLAAEGLRRLHAAAPERARTLMQQLLEGDSEEARRTALKAAYGVGPATRDLFLRAAMRGTPDLRQTVRDTLYLIWRHASASGRRTAADFSYLMWRHDPDFTYGLLRDLMGRIRLRDLVSIRNTLEFIVVVSVTIYINHCERAEVRDQTAALYRALAVDHLHLDRLDPGPTIEKILLRVAATHFAGPVLDWMLFADSDATARVFALPEPERARLRRIAPALDPAADLAPLEDDLRALLSHDVAVLRGAAGLALAVHAFHDFAGTEPLHRRLFEALDPRGRLWQLLSFAVLLPGTPPAWTPLLEDFTRRLVEETDEAWSSAAGADLFAVPLGLAYGKSGQPMALFQEWLDAGLASGDSAGAARVLKGLGPVSFYFPELVFDVLRPFVPALTKAPHEGQLAAALAVARTLHLDAVDAFLAESEAGDAFQRRVSAAAEVALVRRYINVLGYYNNAVHFSVHYPRMRRTLSAGALELLASAPGPQAFVAEYGAAALRMFRDADFQLLEWTRPLAS